MHVLRTRLDDADGMGLHHPTPDQWPDFGARDLSPSVIIPHWELGATALAWLQKPTGRVTRQRRRHLLKANSTGGFTALRCASNGTGLSSRSTTEGVFCALSHPEGNVWPSRAPVGASSLPSSSAAGTLGKSKRNRRKEGGGGGRGRGAVRDPAPRLTWLRSRLVSSSPAVSSSRSERHPIGFASWAFSSPNQQFSLLTHHRSAEMPL